MIGEFTYPVQQESFGERVRDLFSFEGRIGRQSYWLRSFLFWGVNLVAAVLFVASTNAGAATVPLILLGAVAYLAAFLGALATTVKRLHDRSRSGWFMLIAFVPLLGFWLVVEVAFLPGKYGANEYGDPV